MTDTGARNRGPAFARWHVSRRDFEISQLARVNRPHNVELGCSGRERDVPGIVTEPSSENATVPAVWSCQQRREPRRLAEAPIRGRRGRAQAAALVHPVRLALPLAQLLGRPRGKRA